MPKVALVTSWDTPCGIAEHSKLLLQYATAADPTLTIQPDARWLDPATARDDWFDPARHPQVVHLNYHRGLHSQWTPEVVAGFPFPVVITFHDTYEVQPDRLPWDLLACENVKAMVVHEPCDLSESESAFKAAYANDEVGRAAVDGPEGIRGTFIERLIQKVHYWRQGVPEPQAPVRLQGPLLHKPLLGTVGFDFPWKNFDLLADATEQAGWNLLIAGPKMPVPNRFSARTHVHLVEYPETDLAVAYLSTCDVTAFLYTCGNSGTSGAIRLGLAAGRPLIWCECRQFRDLASDLPYYTHTDPTVDGLVHKLKTGASYGRWDMTIVALRERDSWAKLGAKYATLFREVVNG